MTKDLTILVTNDDGYQAQGLLGLIEVAKQFGRVIVIAPEKQWSGKSHAVSLDGPISLEKIDFFGADIEGYISSGTPVDCVKLGINEVLKQKPDLVLSGINHGANYSINMYYSGTVAAAVEAAFHQIPSIAISITNLKKRLDLSVAQDYTKQLIEFVLNHPQKHQLCLNVNVPDIPKEQAKGIKFCRSARAVWIEEFLQWFHPVRKQNYYWLTGKFYNFEPDIDDTDLWALQQGYAAVVPLNIDPTDYSILKQLKN